MKKQMLHSGILAFLLCVNSSVGQVDVSTVGASMGTIRTLFQDQSPFDDYLYTLYPEIQIGGKLLVPYVGWNFYWGYWDDGVDKPFDVADMVTYSNSSHIVGIRFSFVPWGNLKNWLLPVGFLAGFSRHFISTEYIGGRGIDGNGGENFTRNTNTFELGLNTEFRIVGSLSVRGEIQQYFPLGEDEYDRLQKGRRAYKAGLSLEL